MGFQYVREHQHPIWHIGRNDGKMMCGAVVPGSPYVADAPWTKEHLCTRCGAATARFAVNPWPERPAEGPSEPAPAPAPDAAGRTGELAAELIRTRTVMLKADIRNKRLYQEFLRSSKDLANARHAADAATDAFDRHILTTLKE